MPSFVRHTPWHLGALLLLLAILATPAAAHDGHDHDASGGEPVTFQERVEALTSAARVGSARAIAPGAVRGQCVRTVDVPLQGASCDLGGGMWGVRQPDGTTVSTHGPDIYAAGSPQIDLEPALEARMDEAAKLADHPDSDFVDCESDTRVPRTVAVFGRPPGVVFTAPQEAAIVAAIRTELRKAGEFVRAQAELDRAGDAAAPVSLRLHCVGSTIDVRSVTIADPARDSGGTPTFAGIDVVVRAAAGLAADDAARIVAYVPYDMKGVAGQGWQYDDTSAARDNRNNGEDQFAAHYLVGSDPTSSGGIQWDIFLHEMLHNMGAVSFDPEVPDTNGLGHCTSDKDVMCYSEQGVSTSPRAGCEFVQLDCGRDSYFDASDMPSGWLAENWNVGGTHNRYLDFGSRTPSDIVAPTRPADLGATSPAPNTIVLSWTPSVDASGISYYEVRHGSTAPTSAGITSATTVRIPNVPAGQRRLWVTAFDAWHNPSAMSLPVTVTVTATAEAPPITPPPEPILREDPIEEDDSAVAPPEVPTEVRVGSVGVGVAELRWNDDGATDDTTWRVEILNEDTRAWQFATLADAVPVATVRVRPGTRTTARVVASTDAGVVRSSDVRFATSVRGSSCRWVATDTKAPTQPARVKVKLRTARSIKLAYAPPRDTSGVCAVRVLVRKGSGAWRALPTAVAGTAKTVTISGLKPRTAVQVALEAVDARGNLSRRTITRTRTK